MRHSIKLLGLLALVAAPVGAEPLRPAKTTLTVTSNSFRDDAAIPAAYTCEGGGAARVPQLSWSNVPAEAKSIAVIIEDPDAAKGTFTHLLVTDLSPHEKSLAPAEAKGYTALCPPSGTHHYHFRVFALDKKIGQQTSRGAFLQAIDGHVLAQGELVGTYAKPSSKAP